MQTKITACSSTYEAKETVELAKSVASELQKEDKPIKDILDEQPKEDDENE